MTKGKAGAGQRQKGEHDVNEWPQLREKVLPTESMVHSLTVWSLFLQVYSQGCVPLGSQISECIEIVY